jgi:hypothetical protein
MKVEGLQENNEGYLDIGETGYHTTTEQAFMWHTSVTVVAIVFKP